MFSNNICIALHFVLDIVCAISELKHNKEVCVSLLRIATRRWAHVLPLALGDIPGAEELIDLELRHSTPSLWSEPNLDGAETSFSSYVRARAEGDTSVTALPFFIMRGFRHRCFIVNKLSHLHSPSELRGATVGLTGWPDSGNTWTRAIVRDHGIELDEVAWRVGRLTGSHPEQDRLGRSPLPPEADVTAREQPLLDGLLDGTLDAVMTPFMPESFLAPDSPFRVLFEDTQATEAAYFSERRYIPGLHLLTVRTSVLAQRPTLADELMGAFTEAQRLSHRDRSKLQDVTPWTNEALRLSVAAVGHEFNPVGLERNRPMIEDFQRELCEQHLMRSPVPLHELFPYSTGSEATL